MHLDYTFQGETLSILSSFDSNLAGGWKRTRNYILSILSSFDSNTSCSRDGGSPCLNFQSYQVLILTRKVVKSSAVIYLSILSSFDSNSSGPWWSQCLCFLSILSSFDSNHFPWGWSDRGTHLSILSSFDSNVHLLWILQPSWLESKLDRIESWDRENPHPWNMMC